MDHVHIAQIYAYDRECFNSRRRYEEHLALESPEMSYQYEEDLDRNLPFLDTIEDKILHSVLLSLKPAELQIVQLYVVEGLSITEISKIMGRSKSTISEKVQRIIKKLKKLYFSRTNDVSNRLYSERVFLNLDVQRKPQLGRRKQLMWDELKEQMDMLGDKPYVLEKKRTYSYNDLRTYCSYFNTQYINGNVRRVLLCVRQEFVSYSAILAVYLTGATFSVVNPELPLDRKRYLVEQFQPDLIICQKRDEMQQIEGLNILYTEEVPEQVAGFTEREIVKKYKEPILYIFFTSGTTGMPKGCKIKREGFETFCTWASKEFGFNKEDRYGQYVPLYFDMSLLDLFGGTMHGVTLVPFPTIAEKLRPGIMVKKYQLTFLNVVPQFLELLQRTNQFTSEYLSTLRMMRFGGDKIHTKKLEHLFTQVPELKVVSTYGPTETTCFCFYQIVTKEDYKDHVTDIVSIGNTIPGWNAYLAEEENGVGEIVIYGKYIGEGYLTDTDEKKYVKEYIDGVLEETYHTGDYARIQDGQYYFEGRKDAQIKINGNRISLHEVEFAVLDTGVREAAALFVMEHIICFYVTDGEEQDEVTEKEIKVLLQKKLPRYAVPSFCLEMKALPLNANGKLDRKTLRQMAEDYLQERKEDNE